MHTHTRPIQRLLHLVLLAAILASTLVTSSLPAAAQAEGPVYTSQEILDFLGITRPAAEDMTALSLQIAAQVEANGLPESALAPQAPEVGGLPGNLNGKNSPIRGDHDPAQQQPITEFPRRDDDGRCGWPRRPGR